MQNYDIYTITGEEEFIDGNQPLGVNMIDFWKFQFPNIYDYHGELAEFIVSIALGKEKPDNKDYWTLYDIDYTDKKGRPLKIEVKATAYYHSWQTEKSKISQARSFGIAKSHSSYLESSEVLSGKREKVSGKDILERPSDLYVFCLNKGKNRQEAYTLNVQNWEFYIVPTYVLDKECGDNKTISLGRVQKFANAIEFKDIRNTIEILSDEIAQQSHK